MLVCNHLGVIDTADLFHLSANCLLNAADFVEVLFSPDPPYSCIVEFLQRAQYHLVGEFDELHLEDVYEFSQNNDTNWRSPPCRSTMVGDVIVIGNQAHVVLGKGFSKPIPVQFSNGMFKICPFEKIYLVDNGRP